MTDFLFDYGYITNLALFILVFGWLFVGAVFGYIAGNTRGYDKGHRHGFANGADYERSWSNHPSNQR